MTEAARDAVSADVAGAKARAQRREKAVRVMDQEYSSQHARGARGTDECVRPYTSSEAHDVVAAVYVQDFAGDAAAGVRGQEYAG